jgi:hypothetical protein|tara:strand:+ start:155 stop:493 length:339 start_codon:yes stop_codon:yes gene_type:complete
MLFTGLLKLATTNEQFKTLGSGRLDWVDSLSSTQMKIIGVVEALIGFGLMLPQILNFWAWLTPLAAVGAVCTMIGAIVLHIRRKDGAEAIATNFFIIALAIFVAYSRSGLIG